MHVSPISLPIPSLRVTAMHWPWAPLSHASHLDWRSISHMIIYMFQCYSLKSSHPCLLPHSPKVCFLYLCLLRSCIKGHGYHLSKFHAAKSLQSCETLCNPIDGSPPGSAVPGILQARVLEWVAIAFSNRIPYTKVKKNLVGGHTPPIFRTYKTVVIKAASNW